MDDSLTAHDLGSFLLEAAAHGTEEHMAFFLDRVGRADELLVADSRGKTPLHLALARSNVAAARQILRTPHARLKYDFECRLQYLREKRALLHQSGSAAEAEAYAAFAARERKKLAFGLILAAESERSRLLTATDKYGNTPLHVAARNDTGPAAAAVLEDTALFHASCRAEEAAMEAACVRGDAQAREASPLDDPHVAGLDLTEELERREEALNTRNAKGHTPLHTAALHGNVEGIKLLLAHGADRMAEDDEGNLPLDLALHNVARRAIMDIGEAVHFACHADLDPSPNSDPDPTTASSPTSAALRRSFGAAALDNTIQSLRSSASAESVGVSQCGNTPAAERGEWDDLGRDGKRLRAELNRRVLRKYVRAHLAPPPDPLDDHEDSGGHEAEEEQTGPGGGAEEEEGERSSRTLGQHVDTASPTPAEGEASRLHALQLLVQTGADPNERTGFRLHTPLHLACDHGQPEVVRYLLEVGAVATVADGNGWTPLHYCAARGTVPHQVIAEQLITAGADLNARTHKGRSPLALAALQNWLGAPGPGSGGGLHASCALLQLLARKGADLNGADRDGLAPLHHAARRGRVRAVHALLSLGADPHGTARGGWTALHLAAAAGDACLSVVRLLIKHDCESQRLVRALTSAGQAPADVAKTRACKRALTCLWDSAREGDVARTRTLAREAVGAHPSPWGPVCVSERTRSQRLTPIMIAVRGAAKKSEAAARAGRSTDPKAQSGGHVPSPHELVVRHLLAQRADPNLPDRFGATPLMACARFGLRHIAAALLEGGADVGARDLVGNSALHYASAFSHSALLNDLEDAGADRDARNLLPASTVASASAPSSEGGADPRGLTPVDVAGLAAAILPAHHPRVASEESKRAEAGSKWLGSFGREGNNGSSSSSSSSVAAGGKPTKSRSSHSPGASPRAQSTEALQRELEAAEAP